jgi:hypothetical protein
MSVDRSAASRALAKALAHKQAGNDSMAKLWARELIRLLELGDILVPEDVLSR